MLSIGLTNSLMFSDILIWLCRRKEKVTQRGDGIAAFFPQFSLGIKGSCLRRLELTSSQEYTLPARQGHSLLWLFVQVFANRWGKKREKDSVMKVFHFHNIHLLYVTFFTYMYLCKLHLSGPVNS